MKKWINNKAQKAIVRAYKKCSICDGVSMCLNWWVNLKKFQMLAVIFMLLIRSGPSS